MCFEHSDNTLILWMQQRRGVRWKKDELHIMMQVLQQLVVGWSVVKDHQDTEGEALRHAILLQLVHQGMLAVLLKNISRHPTTGIGIPMDRQAALIIPLECTMVFGVVHHDRLKLAVSHQVSP